MKTANPPKSSAVKNFSYPNRQKTIPSKLHWSRTNRMESPQVEPVPQRVPERRAEAEDQQPGARRARVGSPSARPRPRGNSSPPPDRHWNARECSVRKVFDTVMSRVRSVRGSILSLGRRLITPPVEHPPPFRQPRPSRPASSPLPAFANLLQVPPQDFAVWKPTIPVLVEYMNCRQGPDAKSARGTGGPGGVVYLSTDPHDTRDSFVVRARAVAVARDFNVNIGALDEFVGLWVSWNQGCSGDRVDSPIVGDEDFKRAVELMTARRWKDKFLLNHRTPGRKRV